MVVVRAFEPDIDVSNFDSGHAELDRWLKEDAKKRHRYTCFVDLAVDDTRNIVGFVATAHAVVAGNSLGMDVRSAPVLLIARMAVSSNAQGRGIGQQLVHHAFKKAIEMHFGVAGAGCSAVIVDSKPEKEGWYRKHFPFKKLRYRDVAPNVPMYIKIKKLIASAEAADLNFQ